LEDRLAPATLTVMDNSDSATDPQSLRYALATANSGDVIDFAPSVRSISLLVGLTIGTNVSVVNDQGSGTVTFDAGGIGFSMVAVNSGVTALLSGLTIAHGGAGDGSGGGIQNNGELTVNDCSFSDDSASAGGAISNSLFGTLTVSNCTFSLPGGTPPGQISNFATDGGAIYNEGGTATVSNSTCSGNHALDKGGAIYNDGGILTVSNSTFSGNFAESQGGAIYNTFGGTIRISNSTFSSNIANSPEGGGAIYNFNPSDIPHRMMLTGDIVARNYDFSVPEDPTAFQDNLAGANVDTSSSDNLIGFGGLGGLVVGPTGNQVNVVDPGLMPLGNYGGPTETFALLPQSAAVGRGDTETTATTDQRGFPRPVGSPSDVGAFQFSTPPLIVNTVADADVLQLPPGQLSLRMAVTVADFNNSGTSTPITFDPTVFAAPQTITLTSGTLPLSETTAPMFITGPDAGVTIFGAQTGPGISVVAGVTATLSGLTITHTGGISNDGSLFVSNCSFAGNSAPGGGAIINQVSTHLNTPLLSVRNSSFTSNSAGAGGGGAILNESVLTVNNCTFASNSAGSGGAILNEGGLTVNNCTFSANAAHFLGHGGGIFQGGNAVLNGDIVVGNFAIDSFHNPTPNDIYGSADPSSSDNLIGTGSGGLLDGQNGNQVGVPIANVGLAALGNYGGPTQTFALLPGSPALGRGITETTAATDQRGVARPIGTPSDVGAFQSRGFSLTTSGDNQSAPINTAFASSLQVTVSANDPGVPVAGGVVTFTANSATNGAGAVLGTPSVTLTASGVASTAAVANGIAGTYTVTASAGSTNTATFSLNNLAQAATVVSVTSDHASGSVYGETVIFTAVVSSSAGAGTPTGSVQFQVDGANYGASVTLNGGTATFATATLPAGSHRIVAFYASDSSLFSNSDNSANPLIQMVIPAGATINVTGYSVTYDSNSHTATGTAMGVLRENLSADLNLSATTHTAAGTYNADAWSFHDPLGNYQDASGTVTDTIANRDLYVTATANSKTYGQTASDAGTITGVQGADGITAAFSSTGDPAAAPVAGSPYAISTTLSDPTNKLGNYTVHETEALLTVTPASATINVTGYSVTYDSNSHTATGTAMGVFSENLSADLNLSATTHTAAGTYNADTWTFHDPLGNYQDASATVTDIIAKRDLYVTANANSKTYGQTASDTGTITAVQGADGITAAFFSTGDPAAASVAGSPYAISATLSDPNNKLGNYIVHETDARLTVGQATPKVSVTDNGGTYNGLPFPATARVAGVVSGVDSTPAPSLEGVTPKLIYYTGTSASGTALPGAPKTAGTYTVVATFAGSTDYARASASTTFTIGRATPVITWTNPSAITYLTPLSSTQLDATANVPGTFVYSPSAGKVLAVGTQKLSVTFTPTDTTDYNAATATVNIVVLGSGVTVAGTKLYLVGGNITNDQVQINPAGNSVTGSTGVQVTTELNGISTTKTFSQAFTAIYVFGFAGNDIINLVATLTINAYVSGGNGNHTVTLCNGNNTVTLGNGNDGVTAGDGNNTVTLGNGNDSTRLGNGNNVVVEGSGNDNVTVGNGDNLIVAGLGPHTVQAGNGSNILIDGNARLTSSSDSLRQVLNDWAQDGALAANVASIRSRLAVTYNSTNANTLNAGSGLDWFWGTFALDSTNRKPTDLLN
jgi:hypothetical protein